MLFVDSFARRKLRFVVAPLGLLAALSGCSDQGSEGASGSGGRNSGGTSTAGGTAGSTTGAGGSGAGVGGFATGGSTGGVGTGGAGTAGAATGGAGTGGAGTAGAGGGASGSGGVNSTPGCGASTWPESARYSIDVDGTMRDYILSVPDTYDPNQPYRLIFGWHPRGGSAEQVATGFLGGYYGLEELADGSAIFVAPEGIDQGWANTGGRDIAFLRAMLDRFNGELCIDEDRIFSTGFSYGGMMSFAVGCAMGDVFRAIAPMSGALYSGCEDGDHPVAVWGAHGSDDDIVPLPDGESARDIFLERNGCGTATTPIEPSPCVSYEGCTAGYPVVWCEFAGGHTPITNSGASIWAFFSQF
jgi:poly(3-hydroxybutyrate) depolymerase